MQTFRRVGNVYILNQSGTEIHNSEFVERFCIAIKPDASLIIASTGRETQPVTMGRYKNIKEAQKVLFELFYAISHGETSYELPLSEVVAPEKRIKDARVKRKGGS